MRGPRRQLVAIAVALALGACGGDPTPIPRDQAAALIAYLEETQRRVDAGACNDLEKGTFVRLDRRVERLPDDIDSDVEQAVRDGVGHLKDVAEQECRASRSAQTTTTESTPVPSTTTPVPSTTTPAPTTSTTPPTDTRTDGDQKEKNPPSAEPPPKNPDPPAETPGGGTPSQSGGQGGDGQ